MNTMNGQSENKWPGQGEGCSECAGCVREHCWTGTLLHYEQTVMKRVGRPGRGVPQVCMVTPVQSEQTSQD